MREGEGGRKGGGGSRSGGSGGSGISREKVGRGREE